MCTVKDKNFMTEIFSTHIDLPKNVQIKFLAVIKFWFFTRLKNKFENNLTWEGVFYQSEWVKINLSWVTLVFSLYARCC